MSEHENKLKTDIINHLIILPATVPVEIFADFCEGFETGEEQRITPTMFAEYLLVQGYIGRSITADKIQGIITQAVVTTEGNKYLKQFMDGLLSADHLEALFTYNFTAESTKLALFKIIVDTDELDPVWTQMRVAMKNVNQHKLSSVDYKITAEDLDDFRVCVHKAIDLVTEKEE